MSYCFQFEKPGRREDFDYPDMAKEAGLQFWHSVCYSGLLYSTVIWHNYTIERHRHSQFKLSTR